jgi:hypothetical protein
MSLKIYIIISTISLILAGSIALLYWFLPSSAVQTGGYMIAAWTSCFTLCGWSYIDDEEKSKN